MLYVTRAEWGAAPPTNPEPHWAPGEPIGIAIHYVGGSGMIGDTDHAQCAARLRNLQAWATSGKYKWTYSDIEYNLAACHHGYVFEARGIDVQGAAQMNANSDHASVLALANVDDPIVGTPLAVAVNDAVAFFQSHYPQAVQVVGHRDTAGNPTGTNCPGDTIEAWIHAGRPGSTPLPVPKPQEHVVSASVEFAGSYHTFWADGNKKLQHAFGDNHATDLEHEDMGAPNIGNFPDKIDGTQGITAEVSADGQTLELRAVNTLGNLIACTCTISAGWVARRVVT